MKVHFFKKIHRGIWVPVTVGIIASLVGASVSHATGSVSAQPYWASPSVMALKRVSSIDDAQHYPNFLSNLDCTSITYRMVNSGTMQTGCFTPTAFGMLDVGSQTVIFNGTDEGLPLLPYSAHQVLVPWPGALNLMTLDAANTGGSYINMYKNPLALLRDHRNTFGQLTDKQLTGPPDLQLRGQTGQQLVINPQTMAFSDGGSWLVVETMSGSFTRINLASLDMTNFAPAFGSSGSPALMQSRVAVNDSGRFVAIENTVASSFKVYDLTTCAGSTASLQPMSCRAYDYWPFVNRQIPGLKAIRHVRFLNDGVLSFEAVTSSGNDGVYELAPANSITALTDYIGLGDSYTSGEGAFDYLSGTDTASDACHLSVNSYPLLLTRDLFSAAGGHSAACSGAVIDDVGSSLDTYRGQVKNGASLAELSQNQPDFLEKIYADYSPGYIAQHLFVKRYQPRVITVSIGGNDIGFGDMLQNCVEPHVSRHTSDSTCYNTYESRTELTKLVDRTVPRWVALYRQLRAESPDTTIYAIGYPSIASDTGSCPLNVNLGKSELEFAEELIHYLNGSIQQAATTAGVPYVDISQSLNGHRLCEANGGSVAVNGLTAGNDFGAFGVGVLGRESYHPNALGHQLIEQAILRQTNNLTVASPNTDPSKDTDILNVPKDGRAINALVPDNHIIAPVLRKVASNEVHVSGSRDGLLPNSRYSVRLDGATGELLATMQSDAGGSITGDVSVPDSTVAGGHTIDITGTNQAGEPVDVSQPVYVSAGGDDADGDGISDNTDSCPYAINSGQDSDGDGTDDICDSSATPGNGSGTGASPTTDSPDSPELPDTSSDQNSHAMSGEASHSGIPLGIVGGYPLKQTVGAAAVFSHSGSGTSLGQTPSSAAVLSTSTTLTNPSGRHNPPPPGRKLQPILQATELSSAPDLGRVIDVSIFLMALFAALILFMRKIFTKKRGFALQ